MAAQTVQAGEWRNKPVSRQQWWKLAHVALEIAGVDIPADRGAASDLIGQLDAHVDSERAKDVIPFAVAS